MDSIDRFDINLDLADREFLYDYVERERYERPASGTWDLSVFRGKGTIECVHEDDENGQLRVNLLDKAFSDKRILEKKSKKDTAHESPSVYSRTDFGDETQLPDRIIPLYKAGEVVKGTVDLVLNKPLAAEKLVVGLLGRAFVSVRIYHAKGYYDATKEEVFVREKLPLWLHVDQSAIDISDKFTLLGPDVFGAVPRGAELHTGDHRFPFEFTIPHDVPQSTPPVVISGHNKGYLVFRIKAAIDKGKTLARGNIVTHKGLWVPKTVDIAAEPNNLEPVHVEETLDTGTVAFWKSGKITVRVSMPKMGFVRGENVPFTVEINNESKGVINSVSSCVRMYGKARTGGRMSASNTINIKSNKVTEGPVAAGMSPVLNVSLPWDFSDSSVDGNLLPVGDLNDCVLLDIQYEVRIKLKRKGLHRNMEISVPISVGSTNSMAT